MIYLSKPNGTHAVFHSRTSQGAYAIHRLEPGRDYVHGPKDDTFVAERDFLPEAKTYADNADEASS